MDADIAEVTAEPRLHKIADARIQRFSRSAQNFGHDRRRRARRCGAVARNPPLDDAVFRIVLLAFSVRLVRLLLLFAPTALPADSLCLVRIRIRWSLRSHHPVSDSVRLTLQRIIFGTDHQLGLDAGLLRARRRGVVVNRVGLLQHMRQFVSDQGARSDALAGAHPNMSSEGEGMSPQASVSMRCFPARVNAHAGKIAAESRLKPAPNFWRQG
jgi:hypothetical protein